MLTRWAKTAFLSGLGGVTGGTLTVECPDRTYRYGEPGELDATLTVHDERFFLRALTGGDIGIGESFMDGDWTTPDLVPLVRLMLRNRRVLDGQSRVDGRAAPAGWRHRPPPPRQLPRSAAAGISTGTTTLATTSSASFSTPSCACIRAATSSQPPIRSRRRRSRKVDRICRALTTVARRSRTRDRQRLGRVRRVGGDALWLPRDDHDDQRRAIPPRQRLAVTNGRGRVSHRRAARRLPGVDRSIRQDRQHRNVRGGRPQPLRRVLQGRRIACWCRMA